MLCVVFWIFKVYYKVEERPEETDNRKVDQALVADAMAKEENVHTDNSAYIELKTVEQPASAGEPDVSPTNIEELEADNIRRGT